MLHNCYPITKVIAGSLLTATMLVGCAATPSSPSESVRHPANADAAEAPVPARSITLLPATEGSHP